MPYEISVARLKQRHSNIHYLNLLKAAQDAGFEVLVTPEKSVRYQQNLTNYTIAMVLLGNPLWPALRHHVDRVVAAVNAAKPSTYGEFGIPER